jgi:hypothetical protein
MSLTVTDTSSNRNDKIANAAGILMKSEDRRKVFKAIYRGKKRKSVPEIMSITGMDRVRVLQEAKKLVSEDIVKQIGVRNIMYEKIDFYTHNKSKILSLAKDKKKLEKFPTKTNPRTQVNVVTANYDRRFVDHKPVSIDDIESFSKVRKIKNFSVGQPLYESRVKEGLKRIIGEEGEFTDWGGETDDLFSTRLIFKGNRHNVALGLKGRATKGVLTPKKMGKNGDQIQRLFTSPADFLFVLYQGQIHESVVYQMQQFAIAKSVAEGRRIHYGTINEKDVARLIAAYPDAFI